jgi:hypothetical protein
MTEDKLGRLLIKIGRAFISKGLETSGTLSFSTTEEKSGIVNVTLNGNKLPGFADDTEKILDNNALLGSVTKDEIKEAARGIIEEKLKAIIP